MRYLLLIYSDEASIPPSSFRPDGEVMARYRQFHADLDAAGKHIAGEPLVSVKEARTVRRIAGDAVVTDGPFAETKEQLGGFYMIEADSLDEAVEWAHGIPAIDHGCVEVRQVMELPGPS